MSFIFLRVSVSFIYFSIWILEHCGLTKGLIKGYQSYHIPHTHPHTCKHSLIFFSSFIQCITQILKIKFSGKGESKHAKNDHANKKTTWKSKEKKLE